MPAEKRHKAYPLLPFSQLVFNMTRWMPWVYMFTFKWCWPGKKNELAHLEDNIIQVLNHHPVFKMQVDRHGLQTYNPAPIGLKGRYYKVELLIKGEDIYGSFRWSRILGDYKSVFTILFENFIRAYNGEVLPGDKYLSYIEKVSLVQKSSSYAESKKWLESTFADTNIPVRPSIDRKRLHTLLPWRVGILKENYTTLATEINRFLHDNLLNIDGFFSLCVALAIAEYCGTDSAALTWAYEGRETPEEQHIFGSLHRDIPFQIHRINPLSQQVYTQDELVRQARQQIRSGIAHSDYPYTLSSPHNTRWDYAVNIIRYITSDELLFPTPISTKFLPVSKPLIAYAILDIELYDRQDRMELIFRYSATHYKHASMQRFAAMVKQNALWLLNK